MTMALSDNLKNKLRVAFADKSARDELVTLLKGLTGEATVNMTINGTLSVSGTETHTGNETHNGTLTLNGPVNHNRAMFGLGSNQSAANFSLSSGWGDAAAVSLTSGSKDSRFSGNITVGGANTTASPFMNLTFRDGAFTTAPFAMVEFAGASATGNVKVTPSTTGLVIQYQATPVASAVIDFRGIVIG